MAELIYGADDAAIHIPDHLMAHVKLLTATKLRRGESFLMTWRHADGSGRSSIWLQPSIPLRFVFDSAEEPAIDHALLASLAASASSNGGLVIDVTEGAYATTAAPTTEAVRAVHREPTAAVA